MCQWTLKWSFIDTPLPYASCIKTLGSTFTVGLGENVILYVFVSILFLHESNSGQILWLGFVTSLKRLTDSCWKWKFYIGHILVTKSDCDEFS